MLQTNVIEKSGFKTLDKTELERVSGGFGDGGIGGGGGLGPQLTEEDIQFQMMLQSLTTAQKSQFLSDLG